MQYTKFGVFVLMFLFVVVSFTQSNEEAVYIDFAELKDKESTTTWPRDKVIRRVPCQTDENSHYHLYIPKTYDPKVKTPLILVFSSTSNAFRYATYYGGAIKEFADEHGWIVAGSVEAKDFASEEVMAAIKHIPSDVSRRLNIHPKRLYATGFSGGSGMSYTTLHSQREMIDGIVALSTPWPRVGNVPHASVYEIIGDKDFVKGESRTNRARQFYNEYTDGNRVKDFKIIEFPGGHVQAPKRLQLEGWHYLNDNYYLKTDRHIEEDKIHILKHVDKVIKRAKKIKENKWQYYKQLEYLFTGKAFLAITDKKTKDTLDKLKAQYMTLKRDKTLKIDILALREYTRLKNAYLAIARPEKEVREKYINDLKAFIENKKFENVKCLEEVKRELELRSWYAKDIIEEGNRY